MNFLGIYFGTNKFSLVETNGKKLVNNVLVDRSVITGVADDITQKVPNDVKMVAFFKEEIRRNKIEAKEAAIAISGRDMIIRTFDMPAMPKNELEAAVVFEAKKYVPFKMEELVFDFQSNFDRLANRNSILFVGIKRDVLDKYISVVQQLGVKVKEVEFSAFSVLRALNVAGFKNKGITAILTADPQEADELNFLVLESGFPLFSRDIALGSPAQEPENPLQPQDEGLILEKLKTEVRVSLDYYNRKFPTKRIESLILIIGPEHASAMEAFIHELEVPVQFVDILRLIGKPTVFSLSLVKGFSVSLSKAVKNNLTLNLLRARDRIELAKKAIVSTGQFSLRGIKADGRFIALAIIICGLTYAYGVFKISPLKKSLEQAVSMRAAVSGVSADSSYENMMNVDKQLRNKIKDLDSVLNQVSLTEQLDTIPRIIPDGMWLTGFSFRKDIRFSSLVLSGFVSLGDSEKELELVNNFLLRLKNDPKVTKYFKDINITSVERSQQRAEATITNFIITCRDTKAQAQEL